MRHFASVAVVLASSVGCHAPMPSWNMFRSPGATRVPAPPTGGYGVTQPYYATPPASVPASVPPTIAPTSAPVGTGFRTSANNRWSNIEDPAIGPIAKENRWAPTRPAQAETQVADLRDTDVVLASHETAAPFVPSTVVVERDGPIRILPPASSSLPTSESPRLRGMVVNDTTGASEPGLFIPSGRVVDISQLPDVPATIRTATSQASVTSSPTPARQATSSDGGWKSRTTTLRVAGM